MDLNKFFSSSYVLYVGWQYTYKYWHEWVRPVLTNNEIKTTIKIIRSLENRWILLKGTTKKITSHEEIFLNFLRPLMTARLPLIKNVLTPLAKSVLLSLGVTAAASATDATIQKKIFGPSTTTFIFSNNLNDTMKIVKSLEESSLLIGVSEIIKNKAKEQKDSFVGMLFGILGSSLLGNMWAGKGVVRGVDGVIWARKGVIRAGEEQDFKCCLIL